MSGVVLDIGKLKRLGGLDEHEHVECIVLEPWQALELYRAVVKHRDYSAMETSYPFLDSFTAALEGALK
jgi:hypothetical protein